MIAAKRIPKKVIRSHLDDFEDAAKRFSELANRLVERGNALARDPVARARVQTMIERARTIEKSVAAATMSLSSVKEFLGDAIGVDVGKNKLFIESSDTVLRSLTAAVQWFNRECEGTISRLEAGTLGKGDFVKVGGILAAGAAGALLWLQYRNGSFGRTLERLGVK